MEPGQYWIGVLISNVVAVIIFIACLYKPRIGRAVFAILFIWAAFTNWSISHKRPEVYLEYADLAFFGFYRDIINGFFARHTVALVSLIAVCQLLIGFFLLLKGSVFIAGCIGAIIFLFAIAPLGTGSGFPATIIMASGFMVLLKKYNDKYIWQTAKADSEVINNTN